MCSLRSICSNYDTDSFARVMNLWGEKRLEHFSTSGNVKKMRGAQCIKVGGLKLEGAK